MRSEVLFIGGRSGVGKSTTAGVLHDLLVERDVQHAVIEGDALDLAHPAPHVAFPREQLAERNLAAMWANYRALGYRRLVYTNTVSVLEAPVLAAAMGDDPDVTAVLLQVADDVALRRLGHRALGSPREGEVARSAARASELDAAAPDSVRRLRTDGMTPAQVATELLRLTGW